MKTKYNIGDVVNIRGIVRRIEITKDGVINYEVTMETDDVLGQYGFNRVTESEIERLEESKEEYIKEIMEIAVKCTSSQSDGYSQIMRICEVMGVR